MAGGDSAAEPGEDAGVKVGGDGFEATGIDAGIKAGGESLVVVVTDCGGVPVLNAGASWKDDAGAGAVAGRGIEYIVSGSDTGTGCPIFPKILAWTGALLGISGGTGGVAIFSESSSTWLRFQQSSVVVVVLLLLSLLLWKLLLLLPSVRR